MHFKTLVILKQPVDIVWDMLQNQLPQIADRLEDIESIQFLDKKMLDDGQVLVVNIWKASPQLPDFIKNMVNPDMLTWTDSAHWRWNKMSCHWEIVSHYFKEKMHCSGMTCYEPALGGRGCRLSFEGQLQMNTAVGSYNPLFLQGIETILSNLIPANFRKIAQAAEQQWTR